MYKIYNFQNIYTKQSQSHVCYDMTFLTRYAELTFVLFEHARSLSPCWCQTPVPLLPHSLQTSLLHLLLLGPFCNTTYQYHDKAKRKHTRESICMFKE